MSTETKRTITPQLRLQVFALCKLGNMHCFKADDCNKAVMELLGTKDGSHFTDMIYDRDALTSVEFDTKLGYEDFIVEPVPVVDGARAMIGNLEGADEAKNDPIFSDAAATIRKLLDEITRLKVKP